MPDAFFSQPRPFTKRKRDDAPGRDSSARSGSARGARGGSRGGRGGRGDSRGGSRGGRGGARSGGGDRDPSKSKRRERDEELDDGDAGGGGFDSDEAVSGEGEDFSGSEASDDELETPAQKRLRLAQMYLESLEKDKPKDDGIGFDAADLDRDLIAERLQKDVLEHSGKLHVHVGARILPIPATSIFTTPSRSHRGPLTSAVASSDANWLYTSSKDGSIIKWDLRQLPSASTSTATADATPRITKAAFMSKRILDKPAKGEEKGKGKEAAEGHTDQVLTLALSEDGKVLASGGADKVVGAWDVQGEGAKWLRGLGGHKDKVASVTFRQGTQQLYSSSFDRTIKLFDLSTLSYVETLFGHQDCIQDVASLRAELCVSAGGRDKTVRFWKVTEESQLVFRGGVASRIRNVLDGGAEEDGIEPDELKKRRAGRGKAGFVEGSVDVVAMVDDTTFLSGGDSGSICLWTTTKKKPIATQSLAHGVNEYASASEGVIGNARWITALACLPYGDTFASGSWDGEVRVWRIDDRVRSFSQVAVIPAVGFVNSLQLLAPGLKASNGRKEEGDRQEANLVVVAGVAKEPRLGRWLRLKEGREGAIVAVVPLAPEK